MTDNNHPITPPIELVQQWWDGTHGALYEFEAVATQAARWGADVELEACCEWVSQWCGRWPDGTRPEDELRAARRPKPPQPTSVSERLPGPKDCDNAERVWCWSWAIGTWRLSRINQLIHSHWLPAHALPQPS